ncbi:unnamed protein product, partial [Brassica oleracea]
MTDFQSVLLSALRTADAAETEEGWRQVSAPNQRYRPDSVVSSPSCAFFFFQMLSKSGSHCLRLVGSLILCFFGFLAAISSFIFRFVSLRCSGSG